MEHWQRIQLALDYIEARLEQPLTIQEIANVAAFSPYHFQRLFKAVLGDTVKDYIRARRLTQAARELAGSRKPILEIALTYQFESQAAFSRAFKKYTGLTPGRCRGRNDPLPIRDKACITEEHLLHLQKGVNMTPELIQIEAKKLIGIGTRFTPRKDNMQKIPVLWDRFALLRKSLAGAIQDKAYGLCEDPEEGSGETLCFYLACVEVPWGLPLPEGMLRRELPAGTYARFTHKGPISRIDMSIDYIYGSWLPRSGYERASGPDIEVYDWRFRPESEASEMECLLPVQAR